MRRAVFAIVKRPGEDPLQHVGHFGQRHNALRAACLKYRGGPLLNARQMKQIGRGVDMRRLETGSRESNPKRYPVTDHSDENFFTSILQIDAKQQQAPLRSNRVSLSARYQCSHGTYHSNFTRGVLFQLP
jgi:hypothetical protein